MAVCADPDEASPGSIRIGRSLHEERAGLSPAEAARLVLDLASAVHAAHRTGVVHGDLKPENVLVTPETRRVMLADFGLATSLAQSSATGSTPVGTIAYMAPEQWRDRLAPSESSDVYGLGGTLYFLLAGAPPHPGRERGEELPIAPLPATVPQRLREVVLRALAPDPADRPSTAGGFADELRRFREHEPTWHDRRSLGRRLLLFGRRHARELAAVGVVLAVLLPLGIAGYHVFTGQLRELSRREARLRVQIDDLERARRDLERETARLEGEAGAKQQELARIEARVKLLPKLDQALGAERARAEAAEQDAKARAAAERKALDRVATLEATLSEARAAVADAKESLAQATQREAAAVREAGRAGGELAEVRARLASAVADAEAARREAEERRAALEAELRDRTTQLAAAKAARAAGEGGTPAPVPASGSSARSRKASAAGGTGGTGGAEGAQEPRKAPELVQPARQ
jgi:serine/threonine-protein kinase